MRTKKCFSIIKITILFILLTFFPKTSFSQNGDCIVKANKVFANLINSIGNNFPSPPTLVISDEERMVASLSNDQIILEKKALEILCEFPDFRSAIAYVLSHELAHHYLNHTWMSKSGISYASSIGKFIDDQANETVQRRIEETQADLFGGFFSQISGFNSLTIASQVLDSIYTIYKLPAKIKGYPTLDERKEIIKANLKRINKLDLVFQAGKLNILKGDYDLAKKSFQYILDQKFTSREIYNNLGAVLLIEAISSSDDQISKFIYPVFFENNSRTQVRNNNKDNLSRGDKITNNEDRNTQLEKAINLFKRSLTLDNTYKPAKVNLYLSKLLLSILSTTGKLNDFEIQLKEIQDLEPEDYNNLLVLTRLLFKDKKKHVKELLGFSAKTAQINYQIEFYPNMIKKDQNSFLPEKFSKINFKELMLSGLKKPFKYATTNTGLKVKKKQFDYFNVYEINYTNYFIEIFDPDYKTTLGVRIGDNIQKLINLYKYPDQIHSFGLVKYYNYIDQKIIFSVENNIIHSILLYNGTSKI